MSYFIDQMNTDISLSESDYLFLTDLRNDIFNNVGLNCNPQQLVSILINNLSSRGPFLTLLSVNNEVVISMADLSKLDSLNVHERRAMEWLKNSSRRATMVEYLVDKIKESMVDKTCTKALTEDLHRILTGEFNKKFNKANFRSGTRRLIIKTVIVFLALQDEYN